MAKYKTIEYKNDTMPYFPKNMAWWERVLCVLGYHDFQPRFTSPEHPSGIYRLRDQCDRCGTMDIPMQPEGK